MRATEQRRGVAPVAPVAQGAPGAPGALSAPTPPRGDRRTLDVAVSPAGVAVVLGCCVGALVGIHVWLQVFHSEVANVPWLLRDLFDLDHESSFGTWFAAVLLSFAALASAACAVVELRAGLSRWRYWGALGGCAALASLDEIACVHEGLNMLTPFSWAWPAGGVAILMGLWFVPFLRALPRTTAWLFAGAGTLYVGGAVGVELAAQGFEDAHALDTLGYHLTTGLEEGMEMSGVVVFLYAVLTHLGRGDGIEFTVAVKNAVPSRRQSGQEPHRRDSP